MESSNVNVRVGGVLREHLSRQINGQGAYENASEYIRDLIRRDMQQRLDGWMWLAEELAPAMQAKASDYKRVSALDVIARNSKKKATIVKYLFFPAADIRQDEIWDYSCRQWGEAQAKRYITGLHQHLQQLASKKIPWKKLDVLTPESVASFKGVYISRYEKHLIFFRALDAQTIGIMSLLHVSMDIPLRLSEDLLRLK